MSTWTKHFLGYKVDFEVHYHHGALIHDMNPMVTFDYSEWLVNYGAVISAEHVHYMGLDYCSLQLDPAIPNVTSNTEKLAIGVIVINQMKDILDHHNAKAMVNARLDTYARRYGGYSYGGDYMPGHFSGLDHLIQPGPAMPGHTHVVSPGTWYSVGSTSQYTTQNNTMVAHSYIVEDWNNPVLLDEG